MLLCQQAVNVQLLEIILKSDNQILKKQENQTVASIEIMEKSGITVERKSHSSLQCQALDGEDVRRSLNAFRGVVQSCYGPNARLKMLQNACGGHVTVTSSSSRLLPLLSISSPILKLLTVAVEGHLNFYKDGGLFACYLAVRLLQQSLDKTHIHRKLLADVYDYLLSDSLAYLRSAHCPCKFKIDVTSLDSMRCIVRSILSTKPAGVLQSVHIDHLTSLVIELFLRSYAVKGNDQCYFAPVSILCIEGRAPCASHVADGVLFDMGSSSVSRANKSGDSLVTVTSRDRDTYGKIKVALITVSMSGDTSDYLDVVYEVTDADRVDVNEATVRTMYKLCDQFVEDGVGLVLCQKVIHPSVMKYLQKKKLVAVERLGAHSVTLVEELSGAVGINSVHSTQHEYGWLDSVTECSLESKKYLHLQREGASVCSLVLYHRTEESLQEIKAVCEAALNTLKLSLQEPYVLTGAGCWQVHLAAYIRHKINKVDVNTLRELGCTKSQFEEAGLVFASCLEKTASALDSECIHLVDSATHHHWMTHNSNYDRKSLAKRQTSCGCGFGRISPNKIECRFTDLQEKFSSDSDADEKCFQRDSNNGRDVCLFLGQSSAVVDSFTVMLNALRVSVSTCNMLLGISHVVTDGN